MLVACAFVESSYIEEIDHPVVVVRIIANVVDVELLAEALDMTQKNAQRIRFFEPVLPEEHDVLDPTFSRILGVSISNSKGGWVELDVADSIGF